MHYASFGIVALILHIIINRDFLQKNRSKDVPASMVYYRYFLTALMFYYIFDICWGFLYEYRDRNVSLVYLDTWLYFVAMATTVQLWTRYVNTYLVRQNVFRRILRIFGWSIYGFAMFHLLVNFFNPIIFYFTEDNTYVPATGRYYLLFFQVVLYLLTFVYTFVASIKTSGSEKLHNRAVGMTGIVMAVFIVLQSYDAFIPYYAIGCLIGTCIIHIFVIEDEKKEKEVYNQIARSLAEDYEAIYYITIESGRYREFSTSDEYDSMQVPSNGNDFYEETQNNIIRYVHPDDRDFAASLYSKEEMLRLLKDRKSYSYKYRLMVNGESRYFRFTLIMADDKKHFLLYEKDIQEEVTAEAQRLERHKSHVTFGQIAESLATNYDAIYYVDTKDSSYISYVCNSSYGQLEAKKEGADFFADCRNDAPILIHKGDRDRVVHLMNRDNFLTALEHKTHYDIEYRLMMNGRSQYTRLTARKTADGSHFIIGYENISSEIKKEKEHLQALNTEKELARRDELTGTKNKTAYTELERSIQSNLDGGIDYMPFALVVSDLNNLKKINDTEGHKAGDEYIRASAKLLCDIFSHSPVFRIGGDEFVVFLRGGDYNEREALLDKLRRQVRKNHASGSGPVIAAGMAEYEPVTDKQISAVFERADNRMYADKQELKAM
ncbi:MAG: diguanylate cyclase [Lachnospiraceae bacterium]|nr:diguanylate cyclase [Lachnospiraceae bacterium]